MGSRAPASCPTNKLKMQFFNHTDWWVFSPHPRPLSEAERGVICYVGDSTPPLSFWRGVGGEVNIRNNISLMFRFLNCIYLTLLMKAVIFQGPELATNQPTIGTSINNTSVSDSVNREIDSASQMPNPSRLKSFWSFTIRLPSKTKM